MFNCKKNIRGRDNFCFEFGRKKVKIIELYFLLLVRVIWWVFFLLWFLVWCQEDFVCEVVVLLIEV